MEWIDIKTKAPELGRRVLACDNNEKDPVKMYRILDTQFVKMCSDVTHWMYLEQPKGEK